MSESDDPCSDVQVELPRYECHKKVWALKIKSIDPAPSDQEHLYPGGDWYLTPEDIGYNRVIVGHRDYMLKHNPKVGGYYVVYDDGYKSYSPAEAFESGYSLIN